MMVFLKILDIECKFQLIGISDKDHITKEEVQQTIIYKVRRYERYHKE
jgi:hypothetical protein